MNHATFLRAGLAAMFLAVLGLRSATSIADTEYFVGSPPGVAQVPLYLKDAIPPLNMLVMGKDHKNYYEAYNDASDLNGDGSLDIGYRGWETEVVNGVTRYKIDYFGYFNSYACYSWQTNRFVPVTATANKQCGGTYWSGDFLNYLTTSRMDALRRVLYGGWRQTDTTTDTVLQGAFFPQDAHSWGKEYQSVARDGYSINSYAPLAVPATGKYILFAVTTTTGNNAVFPAYQAPLFRVLQNSDFRVWNWVSIEGPVAGNSCFTPANARVSCTGGTPGAFPGHPANRAQYDTLQGNYAVPANLFGTSAPSTINCTNGACNTAGRDDNYLTIASGSITIAAGRGGNYEFAIDGDDAVDFQLRSGSATGPVVANSAIGCYGSRGLAGGNGCASTGNLALTAGTTYYIQFRHEDGTGGDGYVLQWRKTSGTNQFAYTILDVSNSTSGNLNTTSSARFGLSFYDLIPVTGGATRTDYFVRVQSCPAGNPAVRESTCKGYPNGQYKPTGILHDYGEGAAPKMYFGLITGSQNNNLEGGILRRNVGNFSSEIDPATGVFLTGVNGIARTIDRLRMIGGAYNGGVTDNLNSDTNWNWANGTGNCVSQGSRALNNGECRMWGNPLAEMLYEGMRYFAGAAAATPRFATGGGAQGVTEETTMGLPASVTWQDPYAAAPTGLGYPACAKPYQTIVSDVNPSYDGDLPGSGFAGAVTTTGATPASISGFNAGSQGDAIWNAEFGAGARPVFIGEVAGVTDGAPTAKSASSFANIRGLAPEEPTKGGSYYSASVARYGRMTDVNALAGAQNISTYSIALASNLVRIELPVNGRTVTLLPFGKTVSGTFGGTVRKPTNTIVDVYVEQLSNLPGGEYVSGANGGRPYAVFRINYEDVEQGNDHDMDAIVRYEVIANAANTVTVNLTSEYAAGSADQNLGYVISGTTRDGIYLEVRDRDGPGTPYLLNTPPGTNAGDCAGGVGTFPCNQPLTLNASRTFTPSAPGTVTAVQLKDPLWYAAKYGARDPAAWDQNGDGTPDNYFLVSNPLKLREQMSRAFDDIARRDLDPGVVAINGARVGNSSFTIQPSFSRDRGGKDWSGNLTAYGIDPDTGALGAALWNAQAQLPPNAGSAASRNIRVMSTPGTNGTRVAADFQPASLGTVVNGDVLARLGIANVPGMDLADIGSGLPIYTAQNVIDYLRGDTTRELRNGGSANTLRSRNTSVLGDIVNSEPVVASPRSDFGYGTYTDAMFSGYNGYLTAKRTRKPVVYAGANDGMLHAFDTSTMPCTADNRLTCAGPGAGDELFAFIPNAVIGGLGNLVQPDAVYNHRYYVDGQIAIGDAKDGVAWKTVLVGSTGAGARSVFALDVSNPTGFTNANALWELNNSVDSDIGYVYGKPLLLPLENGEWGVLFGNGYGGSSSDPSLYIVNAFDGTLIRKLTANDGDSGPDTDGDVGGEDALDPYNGLGQITAIDRDGNGKADTVYGGDLQGNLWKFDLSNVDDALWGLAFDNTNRNVPLFTAIAGGQRQPITGGIRVSAGPGSGQMVYFGTGRYFVTGDNTVPASPQVQSLYGVWDNGTTAGTRTNLVGQTITSEVATGGATPDPSDDFLTRNLSQNLVRFFGAGAVRGWYLDLALDTDADGDLDGAGERFIAVPRIQSGRVFFTTYTPSFVDCEPGGTNFVYGLDLLSGQGGLANVTVLPSTTPACTNGACGAVAARNQNGSTTQPPIMGTGVAAINPITQVNPTCDPSVQSCASFEQCQVVIYPGQFVLPRACGRQSWRQLK